MKKLIIPFIAGIMAITSCSTHSGSGSTTVTPDTTFNGSYFQITYNGSTKDEKDAAITSPYVHIVILSTSTVATDSIYTIAIADIGGIYGLHNSGFSFKYPGTGTGTFSMWKSPTNFLLQSNPEQMYYDTIGNVTVTYSGPDYIQGTFSNTLNANGFTYPATGSFKILH